MELAIYRNRTYCESPLVPKFCYLAFAFILFKSSCSFHFRSTFCFFYQGTDSFIEHPKIVFCSEYFRHTHSHIILTLYENVWSLNGINIFCCILQFIILYFLFGCCCWLCLVILCAGFGIFVFVFVHRSIYLASSINRLNILHVTIYGLCTRHA